MRTSDFDYVLPEAAIAQRPSPRRDLCRLAIVHRASGAVRHGRFRDLPSLLEPGDLLVVNDSQVLPARIPCLRGTGGAVEVFLLEPGRPGSESLALIKAGGRLGPGEFLTPLKAPKAGGFRLIGKDEDGRWALAWEGKSPLDARLLNRVGLPPLPPYIRRERLPRADLTSRDRRWYQTVYAKHAGSVAAPTAGLHFTPGLLKALAAKKVGVASVTLHVGAGTFLPVKTEALEDHPMHMERCTVPAATVAAIRQAKAAGRRVIAVGTTALRSLESASLENGAFKEGWLESRLFIRPGYRFKVVDALITNFHQPRSTLLPLVSAFWKTQSVLELYADCLKRGYRFLSYGDACFFD